MLLPCPVLFSFMPCSCCQTAPLLADWRTAAGILLVPPERSSPPCFPLCSWLYQRHSQWVCHCCPHSSRRSTGSLGCWHVSRCFWLSSCLQREWHQPTQKPESTFHWTGSWGRPHGTSKHSDSFWGSEESRWSGWKWHFCWGLEDRVTESFNRVTTTELKLCRAWKTLVKFSVLDFATF